VIGSVLFGVADLGSITGEATKEVAAALKDGHYASAQAAASAARSLGMSISKHELATDFVNAAAGAIGVNVLLSRVAFALVFVLPRPLQQWGGGASGH
jgi:hypothetical protein